MAKPRVIALTSNVRTKKVLQRVVTATGCHLDIDSSPDAVTDKHRLVVWDFPVAAPPSESQLRKLRPKSIPILVLAQGTDLSKVMSLWQDPRVGTVMSYRDDDVDERELIVTITKMVKGDIFGLQKYFTWGVTLFSMKIYNYQEKAVAVEILDDAAKRSGCRGQLRRKIQLAADELLINALYHARTDDQGKEVYGEKTGDERVAINLPDPVLLRYATDGQGFAISIKDPYGSLTRNRLLKYLMRSNEVKANMETKKTGAGLGLHEVLHSVSAISWNLSPSAQTEVLCLFDMARARGLQTTRAISIFDEAPDQTAPDPSEPAATGSNPVMKLLPIALIVVAMLIGVVVLFAVKGVNKGPAVTIDSDVPAAKHFINGKTMKPPFQIDLKQNQDSVITVKIKNTEVWSATVQPSRGKVTIRANLIKILKKKRIPVNPPTGNKHHSP